MDDEKLSYEVRVRDLFPIIGLVDYLIRNKRALDNDGRVIHEKTFRECYSSGMAFLGIYNAFLLPSITNMAVGILERHINQF